MGVFLLIRLPSYSTRRPFYNTMSYDNYARDARGVVANFYLRRSHAGQWVMFGFHHLRKIGSLEAVRGKRSMAT